MEEEKLLGKNIGYPETYDPDILVAVPRRINRETYQINEPDRLFVGFDCWHAYEVSFLTQKGLPVVGLLKLVYSAASEFLVESKSFKLYLASFNNMLLGKTPEESSRIFTATVEADLEHLLHSKVKASFFFETPSERPFDFKGFELLEARPESRNTTFTSYQENPLLLEEKINRSGGELKVGTHLLKSNCRITRQPDWGSLYVHIKAPQLPDKTALLKYIVSLRNENHFHEEICEMTFKRLTDFFSPEILMVACLYTRRGGIDICPVRANKTQYLPAYLPSIEFLTQKTFRQ